MITRKALSRRTLLKGMAKGMGVAIGLPFLDAMVPAFAAGPAKKPPVRLMFFYLPNGIDMPNWAPTTEGKLGELGRILKPLEPFRDQMMVLGNLTHNFGRTLFDGAGDHGRCSACYLTGAYVKKTTTDIYVNGPMSMDQVIARQIGNQTKLPSLELGMDNPRQSGSCDSGYSCAYTNNLSWRSETQPMPPILDPRMLYERLFGMGAELSPDERRRQNLLRSSVLDFATESTHSLMRDLGPADRHKLDEYFTAIRSIEQRLQRAAKDDTPVTPAMPKPPGAPADFGEHFRLLTDMLTIAMQADMTRVVTFMVTTEGTSRAYREIGIPDGHHPLTHHGGKLDQLAKVTRINEYHAQHFAAWITRFAAVKEGDGSLLDNSMIVYGAGLNDGNRHVHEDLPTLLLGRGGGSLKPGRRIVFRKETPFSNLHLSLMDRMGVEVESFGDSSGRLSGLEG